MSTRIAANISVDRKVFRDIRIAKELTFFTVVPLPQFQLQPVHFDG